MVTKLQKVKELQELCILLETYSAYKFNLPLHLCACCYRIAQGFLELKLFDEAEIWANEATELQKDCKFAYHILGIIFRKQYRTQDALQAFKKSMDCDPNFLEPLLSTIEILLDRISKDVTVERAEMDKVKILLERAQSVTKSSYDENLQKKLDAEAALIDAAKANKSLASGTMFSLNIRRASSSTEVTNASLAPL